MKQQDRDTRTILGVRFFQGTAAAAVDRMSQGGLLVVPAAPALVELDSSVGYREALLGADMALTDSAFMVLIWNAIQKDHIKRVSGLAYLRELLRRADAREPGQLVWVMAGERSAAKNVAWLEGQGLHVPEECIHIAPMYGANVEDPALVELIERLRPKHVVVTIGGGVQEQLGLYLKRHLSYMPAVHCIGAAIAFLSGDQVRIPVWADELYMGWLFRAVSEPRRFVPRYWEARKLLGMLVKYRERMPDLKA